MNLNSRQVIPKVPTPFATQNTKDSQSAVGAVTTNSGDTKANLEPNVLFTPESWMRPIL